jgi:ABC-type Fe3+/spermidine/putrescine transport system ATPase subunit
VTLEVPRHGSELVLEQITKTFGSAVAVDQVSLSVAPSEFVTLLGPSGIGKTTILRMIGGFLTPDSGRIVIDGSDVARVPVERRPTGMLFQHLSLWPHLSVASRRYSSSPTTRQPSRVNGHAPGSVTLPAARWPARTRSSRLARWVDERRPDGPKPFPGEEGGRSAALRLGAPGRTALAPENTIATFLLAAELGAPGIELDVHLSAEERIPRLEKVLEAVPDWLWIDVELKAGAIHDPRLVGVVLGCLRRRPQRVLVSAPPSIISRSRRLPPPSPRSR